MTLPALVPALAFLPMLVKDNGEIRVVTVTLFAACSLIAELF